VTSAYAGLGFDPVPGDARRVAALAEAISAAGRHAEDAHGQVVSAIAVSQPWHGTAADKFRRRGPALSDPLTAHRDSTTAAAVVLFDWASTLADLRLRAEQLDRRARSLRSRIADTEQLVDEWVTAVSVASTHTRPAAETTLAGHERDLANLHTQLSDVLASAHQLSAEHRAAADRTTARLRALAPVPATAASTTAPTGLRALLGGLSDATRRASAAAGLAGSGPPVVPASGALAVAVAPGAGGGGGSWVFGPPVPMNQLVAALPGDRRT
jgi:ABC-type transporter Mla subunit MlaD